MSRRGVVQPAAAASGVAQPAAALYTETINIGTFNVGMQQNCFQAKKSTKLRKLKNVICKSIESADLSLLLLCEVGDHKQGCDGAGIAPQDLINDVLTDDYTAKSK